MNKRQQRSAQERSAAELHLSLEPVRQLVAANVTDHAGADGTVDGHRLMEFVVRRLRTGQLADILMEATNLDAALMGIDLEAS